MKIVGIMGAKGSGKDTVASTLIKEGGYTKYSFADPMKRAVREIFLWTEEHTDGSLKEVVDPAWGVSPRQVLQHMGTEWGQFSLCSSFPLFESVTGRTLWVRRFKMYLEQNPSITNVVIPDLRFPHEHSALEEMGGVFVRVNRPSLSLDDQHSSEAWWRKMRADVSIENDGDLLHLQSLARSVLLFVS